MERSRLGENGAKRGRGFGPWMEHMSFRDEEGGMRVFSFDRGIKEEGWNSRYADPEADGIRPVFKTIGTK